MFLLEHTIYNVLYLQTAQGTAGVCIVASLASDLTTLSGLK